ncbi:multicomponent Na+:H+ antiporter subunit E [Rubricella aquisinus]|jgi:multicomponent Na+:H+ antiporter subunit E|uniref:Multicomponent Na+:H+ antiporter subunit E n=1 Tax=Rubricella aquisinus TaxID=2028108 RepID=A0A840WHJ6_9RHOB|nr:Na+/H+ antiporter subunit E [Rubricella aquisinus]MBB5514598.1 multicomponent Na+:H+ antiporter subunit E [Rubricella aquisinus]
MLRIFLKPHKLIALILYFFWDLLTSSIQVAWDVVTPRLRAQPKLLRLPLDAKTDGEIMATANLISLTPGTLSLDVSEDRKHLLIHAMFAAKDPEAAKSDLKNGIERRVLEVTR